jgi:hypothetical protein
MLPCPRELPFPTPDTQTRHAHKYLHRSAQMKKEAKPKNNKRKAENIKKKKRRNDEEPKEKGEPPTRLFDATRPQTI